MPRTQLALRLHRPPTQQRQAGRWQLYLVAEAEIGERFTATSRPGPSQWVALARALEPSRAQPPACPLGRRSPQLTHRLVDR